VIDYDLANYIQAGTAIEAVVGERVWPNKQADMVDTIYPCILIFRESTEDINDMDGASGLIQARFEVVSMATSYKQARDLAKLVKDRIHGFRGTMGTTTIDSVLRSNDADFLNMKNNAKTAFYAIPQEYQVHYRET
jgi:hypothetical protein